MPGRSTKPTPREVRRARRLVRERFEEVAVARWQASRREPPQPVRHRDNPLNLLVLAACFALTGYVVNKARLGYLPERMGLWFVASFLGHDLLLFPLYALADRSLRLPLLLRRRPMSVTQRAAAINALRVPALLSGLLLLVFQGPIRHQGDASFFKTSNIHEADYLDRWLLVTGALFLGSAVFYALRLGANRGR